MRTFKFKGNLPNSIASSLAVAAVIASGLALSACSNQPNAKKVFIKAMEEKAERNQSKDVFEPFGILGYVEKLEPKEAEEVTREYYDYNDQYFHTKYYYMGDDHAVYHETSHWPIDKIITLIKTMDQENCVEEKRLESDRYDCLVTTDSINAVMGGSNYYFKNRYKRDINGLNGVITIIRDHKTKEMKFLKFEFKSFI